MELSSNVLGMDVEIILNNDPMFYVSSEKSTIGDASIPYGMTTEASYTASVSPSDIIAVNQLIETDYGTFKVNMLDGIKSLPKELLQTLVIEIESSIADSI